MHERSKIKIERGLLVQIVYFFIRKIIGEHHKLAFKAASKSDNVLLIPLNYKRLYKFFDKNGNTDADKKFDGFYQLRSGQKNIMNE